MKKVYISFLINLCFLMAVPAFGMELFKGDDQSIRQAYFEGVPEEDQQRVDRGFDDYLKGSADKASYRRAFHYLALAKQEKYQIYGEFLSFAPDKGYCKLRDDKLCKGTNAEGTKRCLSLKQDYKDAQRASDKSDVLKKLTQDYKIHLMPKGLMFDDFEELLSLLQQD